MVSRRILVTKSEINGKKLGSMHFRNMYGVNVTRINRSGMDLFADPNLVLQVGDRVMVVGQQDAGRERRQCAEHGHAPEFQPEVFGLES